MATFTRCQGKNACRDNGVLCLTCGRKLHEVEKLRELMKALSELAIDYNYDNVHDYAEYIARKVVKMIEHQQLEQAN
jgi:hypothetical protein